MFEVMKLIKRKIKWGIRIFAVQLLPATSNLPSMLKKTMARSRLLKCRLGRITFRIITHPQTLLALSIPKTKRKNPLTNS